MPTQFVSSIRDPVYGTIPLTECELDVLTLPIINRLRGIKQLGLAYLAFPGANHTRFEHSLGTMHVASLICQGLRLSDHLTQLIRIGALLHDVGHPPFSHTIELAFNMFKDDFKDIQPKKFSHEEWTLTKIKNDKALEATLKKHLRVVSLNDVANIAVGRYGDPGVDSVLDSPVDADKTDYILRDNLHCGFPVALDINTITEILEMHPTYGCVIKSEGLSFIEQLLIGRYHLITKIHQNKINRLGNYLMALSLRDAILKLNKDKRPESIDAIFDMNDYQFYNFLEINLKKAIAPLDDFLMGKASLKELYNFDYSILTPMDRYNASIISARKFLLPHISDELTKESNAKKLYVDVNQAKLPELDLWVCGSSGQYLPILNTPLIRGIVTTSLSWLQVAIYSPDKNSFKLDMDKIKKLYKELDESIDENFDYNLKHFDNNKKAYGLFMLSNLLMNRVTESLHKIEISPEDSLIIISKAIYEILSQEFNDSHLFVDGTTNLAKLVSLVQEEPGIYAPLDEKNIQLKTYNLNHSNGWVFSSKIFVDVEKLVNFGMLYRKKEVVKFKKFFNKKEQLRLSGWGRRYYVKNLESIGEIVQLYHRIHHHLEEYVKSKKAIIQEYLDTSEVEKTKEMTKRREEIRKETCFLIAR